MSKHILKQTKDPLEGRIIFLLILTIMVQFMYPLTEIGGGGSVVITIAYQIFYVSLFVSGIYLVSNNRRQMYALSGLTVAWVIAAPIYTLYTDHWLGSLLAYPILIVFQGTLTLVLLRYIFRARVVSRDVLLAACAVYLLIGATFVSVYGVIEMYAWFVGEPIHAFADGMNGLSDERPIPWQTLIYYSYSTLTTLGYGDVLPVTPWARSAATLEAVIGVLYTGIIVARLVGLYATKEIEDELEEIGVIP